MAYYIPGEAEPLWARCGLYDEDVRIRHKDANYHYCPIINYIQNLDINDNLVESPTDMMLQKKEQKDAELDKKIEALRRKNEALMKRYQEVEEDKKRAEQGGMALQSRKGKVDDLTITINKSSTEKRVVTKKGSVDAGAKVQQEWEEGGSGIFSSGRGKRRQLLVTTAGNIKGKRVVSERTDRNSSTSPGGLKPPSEDKDELLESTSGGRHCPNTRRNQVGKKQERKCYTEEPRHGFTDYDSHPQHSEEHEPLGQFDHDVPRSSEEQLEYLRWKKEREAIDRERVARHKNSQGQWRRAWDMDKPELMFSDKARGAAETTNRGGRNARRGHLRSLAAESRAPPGRQHDKRGRNVPVVGSKAKGKDRLTGRARRWDGKVGGEQIQGCPETSLEEFLEELDALCDPEVDNSTADAETRDGILKVEPCDSVEPVVNNSPASSDTKAESQPSPTESTNTDTSSTKGAEKKVRFSEELIQGAHEKNACADATETKASSLKSTSRAKPVQGEECVFQQVENVQEEVRNVQEKKDTSMDLTGVEKNKLLGQEDTLEMSVKELPKETDGFVTKSKNEDEAVHCYILSSQNGSDASACTDDQHLLHPVEHMKSNTSRSTEELIDSSLSVLSLESGDPLPDHNTSTDKARENGKVV